MDIFWPCRNLGESPSGIDNKPVSCIRKPSVYIMKDIK